MGAGFNEDVRRDAVEGYVRALAKDTDRDERRAFIGLLRAAPGEMALPAVSPLLFNADADDWFGSDDMSQWKTPLALPYLLERLGRDNSVERRAAQSGLVRLCIRYPRLRSFLAPLLRAGLSESDSSFRRLAQLNLGVTLDTEGMTALLDAMEFQGGYEGGDAAKAVYSLTARTMGYGYAEPAADQAASRQRLRGWWELSKSTFKPLSLYVAGSSTRPLRIYSGFDAAQRNERLESVLLGADCRASGTACAVLLGERASNDPLWTTLQARPSVRDRAHAMIGLSGDSRCQNQWTLLLSSKAAEASPALLRALALPALASINDSGPKVIVDWLRGNGEKENIYWRRLGVVCLGSADKEPESLKYLDGLVDKGLNAPAPDPLAFMPEKPSDEYALYRAALMALCARSDATEILLRVLKESGTSSIRELCARELSMRRHHPAVPAIIKAIDRADRYEWHDLCRALLPMLKPSDGALIADLLNAADSATRSAGAFLLVQRPDVGTGGDIEALLVSGLADTSSVVRYYCAEALGKRRADAVRRLVAALGDEDEDVRAAAAEALGRLGDVKACAIAAALSDKERRLDYRWLRAMAIGGGALQYETLVKLSHSTSFSDQRAALEAFGGSSQPAADERLLKVLRNDESAMQTVALDALAGRGASVIALLKPDLEAAEPRARARAALLLSKVNSPAAKAALKPLLEDKDENVRLLARFIFERAAEKTSRKE